MSKTQAQLAARVLERLKVTSAGETPTAEDSQSVQDFYANTFGEMSIDGLTYWEVDDIPDEAFEACVDFIAGRIAPDFVNERPDLEASGRARLRVLASQGPTGRIVTGEYF